VVKQTLGDADRAVDAVGATPRGRKGAPFAPDERMTWILEEAARIGNGQLRVQSFADRCPDRVVWPGTYWE